MRRAPHGLAAAHTGVARALRLGALVAAVAVAASVALAQQTWEPTVSSESAKVPAGAPAATPLPRAKPAPAAEPVAAPASQPDAKGAAKAQPAARVTPAAEYCANIASAASDARFAWQKKAIAEMEQEIAKRLALLEEKTAELQKWVARRDEFSKKASETVLRIYQRMRPDAAALQLQALDEETAAAVLTKLEPRVASLILNDMDPGRAARLTATISNAGKVYPPAAPKTAAQAPAREGAQ